MIQDKFYWKLFKKLYLKNYTNFEKICLIYFEKTLMALFVISTFWMIWDIKNNCSFVKW